MKRKGLTKNLLTHRTKLGEIFCRSREETKHIIKQMEAYGLHSIGYGVDYNKTIEQHAFEQSLPEQQLKNLLKSINKNL